VIVEAVASAPDPLAVAADESEVRRVLDEVKASIAWLPGLDGGEFTGRLQTIAMRAPDSIMDADDNECC
jgi:hypothetical protein